MIDLILTPRDGMFLKDGREWATSQEGRAHSLGWPMPSTLFGALVTARGRLREAAGSILQKADWLRLAAETRLGPTIALRRPIGKTEWHLPHRLWPVPADALFLGERKAERLRRLDPVPPLESILGRDDEAALKSLWWPTSDDQSKPARPPQWWSETAFVEWLADPQPWRDCSGDYYGIQQPRHMQAHVGIDPTTQAARESILFAHDVVETIDQDRCEWAIGCRAEIGDDLPTMATLGGDRRLCRVAAVSDGLFAMPERLRDAFASQASLGLRLVAVTPAAFAEGSLPDGFHAGTGGLVEGMLPGLEIPLILQAAFVPRATHVSGWDMAERRPKPTTRLVPPGAVYHFVRRDGRPFAAADAERLWLVALGGRNEQGFGRFVPGVWHPKETR